MTEFTTWRSLVDGDEIFAIPDFLDNWEDAPDGLYESDETIVDYWSGSTGDYERSTDADYRGDFGLVTVGTSDPGFIHFDGDEPAEGEAVSALFKRGENDANPTIYAAVPDDQSDQGYGLYFTSLGVGLVIRNPSFDATWGPTIDISDDISSGEVFEAVIEPPESGDDTIRFAVYTLSDIDGMERDEKVGEETKTDTEFAGNTGVAIARESGSDTGPHIGDLFAGHSID